MRTQHDHIRTHLLRGCGVEAETIADRYNSEWSPLFERLMRNRLVMGSFRYERFADKRNSFNYDTATEAIKRIKLYQKDGNTEHLVDAANMCLLEFEFGGHPKKHFNSIDDGLHATPKQRFNRWL